MKKAIALILSACMLNGGAVSAFAQTAQNQSSQRLADRSKKFKNEDEKIIQAGLGFSQREIGYGILCAVGFGITVYSVAQLYTRNKSLIAQVRNLQTSRAKAVNEAKTNGEILLRKEQQNNATAQKELFDFLKTEKSSQTFKIIDQAAKDLGPDLNAEMYANVKTDAYELRKMFLKFREPKMNQYYIDVYRNPETLKQLMSRNTFERMVPVPSAGETESLASLSKGAYVSRVSVPPSSSELLKFSPYGHERQAIISNYMKTINKFKDELGITVEDVTISAAGKDLIKNVLKNKALIVTAVLIAASSLGGEMQAKVTRLAQNPELVFEMDPATDDARVFDAIDAMKDDSLRKSLEESFDAAHEFALDLKNMSPREQRDISSSFLRQYKEQTKEYSFDGEKKERVETQGKVLTGSLSRFTK